MSSSADDSPPLDEARPRTDEPPPLERLAALALFGPLDLTIKVVEELPSSVERARQQLVAARFLGKMVVDQSLVQARRRLGIVTVPSEPRERTARPSRDAAVPPTETTTSVGRSRDDAGRGPGELPEAADLALPDYEHLPAAHVVAKLEGLTQAERDDIEAFEAAHRHRRTVLGKLQQLREA